MYFFNVKNISNWILVNFVTLWIHSNKVKYIPSYKIKTLSIFFYKNDSNS